MGPQQHQSSCSLRVAEVQPDGGVAFVAYKAGEQLRAHGDKSIWGYSCIAAQDAQDSSARVGESKDQGCQKPLSCRWNQERDAAVEPGAQVSWQLSGIKHP